MAFWDWLTGGGARRDLQGAYTGSEGDLASGYADARGISDDYYGRAQNYLAPYIQRGNDADAVMRNALGLNGRAAQTAYYHDFQTDPGFQGEVDAGVRTLDRSAAGRGNLYSGAQMKALQGWGQQKMGEAYRQRYNMLAGYGQQGLQASQAAAGMAGQHGSDMTNLRYGYGQQRAGNRIQFGNAMAGSRNTLTNNLLGLGNLAVRAASAYATGGMSEVGRSAAPRQGVNPYPAERD